jgi:hypothetical protein
LERQAVIGVRAVSDTEEFTLSCAECGQTAVTILIAPPGTPLPERASTAPMPLREWRYEVEVLGLGGVTAETTAEGAASLKRTVETGDLEYLLELERPIAGAICRKCRAAYCVEHISVEKVVEECGAPMYDYYYSKTCCKGHRGTYERI